MPNDNQAQADSQQENETVEDPLDASDVPDQGATELAEYAQFVDGLEDEQGDEPAESDEETTEDSEEEASGEEEESQEEESTEEEAETPTTDEEEEPEQRTTDRFRIRAKDEVEAEALSLRKRHPDWSLEDCISKAKDILGVKPPEQEENGNNAAPSRTVAQVNTELADLRAKHKEATTALEFDQAAELFDQIEQLRDEREELRVSELRDNSIREQQEQNAFERQFEASETKAVTFYPDTTDPDSQMTQRILELDHQMRDLGDPLYHSPDKPFILAKQAAKELGIPMRNPNAPAAKKSATSKSRPIQPASGNARTTPNTATAGKLEEQLGRIDSLEAYEDLAASL